MSELKRQFLIYWPNNANGALMPSFCALALAATAAAQLLMTGDVDLPVPAGPPAQYRLAAMPRMRVGAVPDVLSRQPIFSPARTRNAAGGADAPAGPLAGTAVAGAVIVRGRAHAVLQEPGGAIRRLPKGASYGGWQLVALTADAAIFSQSGKRVAVPFGRAPVSIPAPAAGQPAESEEQQ